MIFFLGIMDLLAAVWLVLSHFGLVQYGSAIIFVLYLIAKLFMFRDFISIIDFFAALYLVAIFYGLHTFLVWVFSIYLAQKAIFSMIRVS